MAVAALSGAGSAPQLLERSPKGWLDQALLPLSACSAPKEAIAVASEALALTENLCTACVGACGSVQKQPKAASLPLLCLSQIWCKAVVWSRLGLGVEALWL